MSYYKNYSNNNYNRNKNQGNRDFHKGNNKNYNQQQKKNNQVISEDYGENYVGAPYNFVPIAKEVHSIKKEQMENRSQISNELFTGEISYKIKSETPIFIGDGNHQKENGKKPIPEDFFRNENGKYAIPGSSVRGLVRTNAQILGLADISEDVDDYQLMFRNVAEGADKKLYSEVLGAKTIPIDGHSVSVLLNVAAGYIACEGGKYYIYKTAVESIRSELGKMNYFVLSERTIAKKYQTSEFAFFKNHQECLENKIEHGFSKVDRNGRTQYIAKDGENKGYKPFYLPISYKISNGRFVSAVGDSGEYPNEGYLVGTGHMKGKKALYVIPQKADNKFMIPDQDARAYKNDYENKKNGLKQYFGGNEAAAKAFYGLPEEGKYHPVFYIELENGKNKKRLYFGSTPRLRLFNEFSVKDGLNQKKEGDFDLVNSIFGMSNKNYSYQSKVSFTDAITNETQFEGEEKVNLASPKPSSYLNYLVQSEGKDPVTYNSEQLEIRGIKQYWLHQATATCKDTNNNLASSIRPLKAETEFNGKIRFRNLTEEELGLLVWSIRLKDNMRMNIGKAKAYGYGVISVNDVQVKILLNENAYSSDLEKLEGEIYQPIDSEECIRKYKDYMKDQYKIDVEEQRTVQNFFLMKDTGITPKEENIRYMSIEAKEFQNGVKRNLPLRTVEKTVVKNEHSL